MNNLKLAGGKREKTVIDVNGTLFGGGEIILMAGPCAVESREQVLQAAADVKKAGGKVMRGGVFKPRTSPYSFQGLGPAGLDYLVEAAREHDLLCVSEAIDAASLELIAAKADIIQIGARNMQNFSLLKLAGSLDKPVLLKRGLACTVEEWLLAAEYIMAAGNPRVILCERGIRTFETSTRSTLDLSAIAVVRELSHLPVIVDPSHAAGRRELVPALSKAAIGVGADGLLIEMHPEPETARCDGIQSLRPGELLQLAREITHLAAALGRTYPGPSTKAESLDYPEPSAQAETLDTLRGQIDLVDRQIVALIADRQELVRRVANHKQVDKVRDGAREKEIVDRLGKYAAELGCSADLVKDLYHVMFNHGVRTQIETKLAGYTSCTGAK